MAGRAADMKKLEQARLDLALDKLGMMPRLVVPRESPDFAVVLEDGREIGVELVEVRDTAVADAAGTMRRLRRAIEEEMDLRSIAAMISLSFTEGGSTLLDGSRKGLKLAAGTIVDAVKRRMTSGRRRGTITGAKLERLALSFLPHRLQFWKSDKPIAVTGQHGMGSKRRLIRDTIALKEAKLPEYRAAGFSQVWLLIVGSAGAGGAIDIHDTDETYVTRFEAVLFLELLEKKCVFLKEPAALADAAASPRPAALRDEDESR